MADHLGASCIYDRVRRRFFCSMLSLLVNPANAAKRFVPFLLGTFSRSMLPVTVEPSFFVGLNVLSSFLLFTSGAKWIAVDTDYTMWYPVTRALLTSCATDVADFLLYDIILVHGASHQHLIDHAARSSRLLMKSCDLATPSTNLQLCTISSRMAPRSASTGPQPIYLPSTLQLITGTGTFICLM